MTTDLNDDDLDLKDEESEEFHDDGKRFKKTKTKLYFSSSVPVIVDEAVSLNTRRRSVVIVTYDVENAKEIIALLKERIPGAESAPLRVDYISVVAKPLHYRRLIKPEYAIVHTLASFELAIKLKEVMSFSSLELEEFSNIMLKEDANRELCRICKEADPESLPYGEETGEVESVPQFNKDAKGNIDPKDPILDDEGNPLYLDFPEIQCEKGHFWYKGEGARRDIKGKNPILLASHLYQRQRREIQVESGTPDPSFSRNRFDRPEKLLYNRSTPDGRKVNSKEARQKSGASFYG